MVARRLVSSSFPCGRRLWTGLLLLLFVLSVVTLELWKIVQMKPLSPMSMPPLDGNPPPERRQQVPTKRSNIIPSVNAQKVNEAQQHPSLTDCNFLIYEPFEEHREVLPTWIYLANEIGVVPKVNASPPKYEPGMLPLGRTWGLNYTTYVSGDNTHWHVQLRNTFIDGSAIPVFTKWNPQATTVNWPASPDAHCSGSAANVVHIPDENGTVPEELYQNGKSVFMLCPQLHLQGKVDHMERTMWTMPSLGGPTSFMSSGERIVKKNFVLQGLQAKARNYDSLERILDRYCVLNDKGLVPFRLILLGHPHSNETQNLAKSKCVVTESGVSFERFHGILASSYFLLPLLDGTFDHGYFRNKCTSSLPMALMHQVPVFIDSELQACYGDMFEEQPTYTPQSFVSEFGKLLNMSLTEYNVYRESMVVAQENMKTQGRETFQKWLKESCVAHMERSSSLCP